MNLLSIGGSDPSTGAGIQSDIKTFSSFNVHALTVITAITAQNTSSFRMIEPVSEKILKNQLESVMSDFKIGGIKIGMVYNSRIIRVLYHQLKGTGIPIVIDPVFESTTGGRLIQSLAIKDFEKFLVPLATVITPNKSEAEIISKTEFNQENTPEKIARIIQKMGSKNVVITGVRQENNQISDFVLERNSQYFITGNMIPSINHGSGCNHSAAMIFALAKDKSVNQSARFAKQFTYNSIKNAKNQGRGIAITDTQRHDKTISELSDAIEKFVKIRDIYKNIPECQTNFVYTRQRPKSTRDVLGISGRIIKTGEQVMVAGNLTYGGSKHVATALLVMNKRFPQICSAINLKYQDSTISKIKESELMVSSYDRSQEPKDVKFRKSTIKWGIENAIRESKSAPDAVYHKGDFGKESMIIVFGKDPGDVLKKIVRII